MNAALETASLFLKPGRLIVSAKGRNVAETNEKRPDGNSSLCVSGFDHREREKTASAAEIVSGRCRITTARPLWASPVSAKVWCRACIRWRKKRGWPHDGALLHPPAAARFKNRSRSARDRRNFTSAQRRPTQTNEPTSRRTAEARPGRRRHRARRYGIAAVAGPFRSRTRGSGSFTSFASEYVRAAKNHGGLGRVPAKRWTNSGLARERRIHRATRMD